MLYAGWTYDYIASLDSVQLLAAVEAYARMREEELNLMGSILGVKGKGRGR